MATIKSWHKSWSRWELTADSVSVLSVTAELLLLPLPNVNTQLANGNVAVRAYLVRFWNPCPGWNARRAVRKYLMICTRRRRAASPRRAAPLSATCEWKACLTFLSYLFTCYRRACVEVAGSLTWLLDSLCVSVRLSLQASHIALVHSVESSDIPEGRSSSSPTN